MLSEYLFKKFVKSEENSNAQRKEVGVLSGVIGIILNTILAAAKFIIGALSSSVAIVADATNNLSDAISSVVTLICFKVLNNPPTKNYPFGYGRTEYVAGLTVSVLVTYLGFEFLQSSVKKIFSPDELYFSWLMMSVLAVSMLIKLWLYIFSAKLGKKIKSQAMKATAFNNISDVFATLSIIIGMILAHLTGWNVIDGYVGAVVSIFIIFSGIRMIKDTIKPILGEPPDPEFVKNIEETVKSQPHVIGLHDLIIHSYGPGKMFMSLHLEMPANIDVITLHNYADDIENLLKDKFKCETTIHVDPIETEESFDDNQL